jgi:hypothetical protein
MFIKAQNDINNVLTDRYIIINKSDYFIKQAEYVENCLKLKYQKVP